MKIGGNTLQSKWEKWTDPGDYPSGAGSSPLPARWFVESISGSVRVTFSESAAKDIAEIESESPCAWLEAVREHMDGADSWRLLRSEAPDGVASVTQWEILSYDPQTRVAVLRPEEWESE
jgi:hypothetical protein